MKIVVQDPDPFHGPSRHGFICKTLPSLENAEFFDENGNKIEGIIECTIEMKHGEPIVARVTHLVSSIAIESAVLE